MKVEDYVRTKYGISKIKDIPYTYCEEDIIKSSPNIIDLIEVGDYVNGCKVSRICGTRYDENDICCWCDENWDSEKRCLVNIRPEQIKTIITHKQIESMQYKVGE